MIYDFSGLPGTGGAAKASTGFRSDVEQNEPLLGLENPDSQDRATVTRNAQEMIRVSGAHINIYARTDNRDFDEVFDEDPDPTYWPPVVLRGYFKPQPLEVELKRWGIDAPNKTEVVFTVADLQEKFGERMLRAGDVLQLPYNSPAGNPGQGGSLNPMLYRVLNGSPSGNFRYNWLYFTCTCETLTADITVIPDGAPGPTMPIGDIGGRELPTQ